jgi:hypothetical protein
MDPPIGLPSGIKALRPAQLSSRQRGLRSQRVEELALASLEMAGKPTELAGNSLKHLKGLHTVEDSGASRVFVQVFVCVHTVCVCVCVCARARVYTYTHTHTHIWPETERIGGGGGDRQQRHRGAAP